VPIPITLDVPRIAENMQHGQKVGLCDGEALCSLS